MGFIIIYRFILEFGRHFRERSEKGFHSIQRKNEYSAAFFICAGLGWKQEMLYLCMQIHYSALLIYLKYNCH